MIENKPSRGGVRTPMNDSRGYLTIPQVWKIIDAADSPRDRLLIMTLAMTGRRVSEVIGLRKQVKQDGGWKYSEDVIGGLKPEDILPDRNAIVFNILKKKNPVEKVIGVPSRLKESLLKYIKARRLQEDELVFPITRQRVHQIVKRMGRRSGIEMVGKKPLHVHHFRHSFAVYMADKTSLKKLQELLAHSDINMTAHYLQYSSKDIEKDIEEAWK